MKYATVLDPKKLRPREIHRFRDARDRHRWVSTPFNDHMEMRRAAAWVEMQPYISITKSLYGDDSWLPVGVGHWSLRMEDPCGHPLARPADRRLANKTPIGGHHIPSVFPVVPVRGLTDRQSRFLAAWDEHADARSVATMMRCTTATVYATLYFIRRKLKVATTNDACRVYRAAVLARTGQPVPARGRRDERTWGDRPVEKPPENNSQKNS